MKIVLWCFHEAGYRTVRSLFSRGHELLVITSSAPDHIPSVLSLSETLGIRCLVDPDKQTEENAVKDFDPELGLSMYYPKIVHKWLINIPRMGSFNFHPSLLPKHKGCFSAPWAIIEGDSVTGVTCHEMNEEVDAGRILLQERVPVESTDTAFSLYYRLADTAVGMLDEVIDILTDGKFSLAEQSGPECYHKRTVPNEGLIDTTWSDDKIDRFIRAMFFPPYPPASVKQGDNVYEVSSFSEYRDAIGRKP